MITAKRTETTVMVVIYSLEIFKCLKTYVGCHAILKYNRDMLDLTDNVWIVPGMFDALYNN